MGLTTIRDYDEYTFTHSVNVCIFSVALGRKLGLLPAAAVRPRAGGAAPRHRQGAGAGRDPQQDRAAWTSRSGAIMQAHPWLGALTLFQLRGYDEMPVPRDRRGARAPHEDRPHRLPADGAPARAGHLLPDRRGGGRLRRRDDPAELSDGADRARSGAAGDVGESAARLRHGPRQGADQPDRHLPGRDLRHSRHLRGRASCRRRSRRPVSQPAAGARSRSSPTAARCPPPGELVEPDRARRRRQPSAARSSRSPIPYRYGLTVGDYFV